MASVAPVAGNVSKFRFSTDDFSERERITAWREIFGRTVCRLDIEPLAGPRFQAESTIYALPGIGVLSGSCSGVDLTHSRELIVDDDLSFMTGSMRSWTASQLGRSPTLGAGDGVLMSNAEVGSMLLPAAQHFVTFKVPVSAIAPFVPDVGALIARRVPRETEALRLLVRYLDVLQNEGTLESVELRRLAVTHVYDLFALALGATRDAGEVANGRGLRAARLLAIKSDIDTRLGESDFSVNAIATAHDVTPRYVQILFEREGTTFSEYLLARRLDRAHRMLENPRFVGLTITAIAFEVGFNDLSYFNRSFRRRFGSAPSDVRAATRDFA